MSQTIFNLKISWKNKKNFISLYTGYYHHPRSMWNILNNFPFIYHATPCDYFETIIIWLSPNFLFVKRNSHIIAETIVWQSPNQTISQSPPLSNGSHILLSKLSPFDNLPITPSLDKIHILLVNSLFKSSRTHKSDFHNWHIKIPKSI